MPTSEPYTPGEIARTLDRMDRSISTLSERVVTKADLELHLGGLRQQLKAQDDRHNELAAEVRKERDLRKTQADDREKEQRTFRRSVGLCILAAVASIILPLVFRGVGLS